MYQLNTSPWSVWDGAVLQCKCSGELEEWEGGRKKERETRGWEWQKEQEREEREKIEMKWEREADSEGDMVREREAERENISQRASRCECVGSEQQHIRLHRGSQRDASWLRMPSAKTDIWFLTQPNSCIWPSGRGSESNQRGSGDGGCLLTPQLYVMYCFSCPSSKKRCKLQGVIWWGAPTSGNSVVWLRHVWAGYTAEIIWQYKDSVTTVICKVGQLLLDNSGSSNNYYLWCWIIYCNLTYCSSMRQEECQSYERCSSAVSDLQHMVRWTTGFATVCCLWLLGQFTKFNMGFGKKSTATDKIKWGFRGLS